MGRSKKRFHAWQLYVIENFMREVAQSVWGGEKTSPNDRNGDLYDPIRRAYAEVKASCQSGGAIIRKHQLQRHRKKLVDHDRDYILGYYKNKGRDERGKYRSLTCHIGKTKELLENFLAERTNEIYIVHVSVVLAVYRHWRRTDERKWRMKEGPRTGLKLRGNRFSSYIDDVKKLAKIGLDPAKYVVERTPEVARFGRRKIPVMVSRIIRA